MSHLLIPGEPLQVLPSLAKAIGLNEAIFLQQLHYWMERSKHEHDGRVWVYNTFEEWQGQFPFWSLRTMQRIAASLVKRKLLVVHKFGSKDWDQKNWYSIDYEALSLINTDHAKMAGSMTTKRRDLDHAKMARSYKDQEITQETTTETRAIGNGYKAKKPRRYEISEFENPDALDPDQSFRKYLQTLFPTVPVPEFYKKWYLSRLRQGGIKGHLGRGAPLEHYHADMEFFWGICAENGKQSNGNGHKRFEPEYTGPVKSKPNPKLENCPDCRGTGTILVEVGNGMKCAKVCKHERSEVVVA